MIGWRLEEVVRGVTDLRMIYDTGGDTRNVTRYGNCIKKEDAMLGRGEHWEKDFIHCCYRCRRATYTHRSCCAKAIRDRAAHPPQLI